jgi:hypothetical protein
MNNVEKAEQTLQKLQASVSEEDFQNLRRVVEMYKTLHSKHEEAMLFEGNWMQNVVTEIFGSPKKFCILDYNCSIERKDGSLQEFPSVMHIFLLLDVQQKLRKRNILPESESTCHILNELYAYTTTPNVTFKELYKHWQTDLRLGIHSVQMQFDDDSIMLMIKCMQLVFKYNLGALHDLKNSSGEEIRDSRVDELDDFWGGKKNHLGKLLCEYRQKIQNA